LYAYQRSKHLTFSYLGNLNLNQVLSVVIYCKITSGATSYGAQLRTLSLTFPVNLDRWAPTCHVVHNIVTVLRNFPTMGNNMQASVAWIGPPLNRLS